MQNIRITKRIYDESKKENFDCSNVVDFINKHELTYLGKGADATVVKLIDNVPMALKVMSYNSSENYIRPRGKHVHLKDNRYIKNMLMTLDFMKEANETGFEYFPYIYEVLNCPVFDDCVEKECTEGNSKVYIFYEVFDGTLEKLILEIKYPSEWYDIIFQMALTNYYMEVLNGYRYKDAKPKNILYKKLPKMKIQEYELDGQKVSVKHNYVVVLWDFNYLEKITPENKHLVISNIEFLLRYLRTTPEIPNPPNWRMMKLLRELRHNPENTHAILRKYYLVPSDSCKAAVNTGRLNWEPCSQVLQL